jgi:hypothetical protein
MAVIAVNSMPIVGASVIAIVSIRSVVSVRVIAVSIRIVAIPVAGITKSDSY